MSAAQQAACPVCDGKGFLTTVPGPRVRLLRRRDSSTRVESSRRRESLESPGSDLVGPFAVNDDCLPEFLANLLLRHHEPAFVSTLFGRFGAHRNQYGLSREKWLTIAWNLREGATP
jgi:hypothetical protein